MDALKNRKTIQWGFLILWGLSLLGFIDYLNLMKAEGWLEISRKIQLSRAAGWGLIGLMGLLAGTLLMRADFAARVMDWLNGVLYAGKKLRWPALALAVLFLPVYPLLIFGEASIYLDATWTRLAVFAWLTLLHSILLTLWQQKDWLGSAALSAVILAVVYHFATYLPHISNFPFGLWWSEVSRYYLASTFFDTRIYGVDTSWVFRDTTRYLMQAAPFIFPSLPLWVHRLWQVLLRFGLPYVTGWVFARRLKLPKWTAGTLIFILWAGLYLFQGPVFY
ncbi:MAG TPA: hypothetical protein VJ965_12680, partial [Anaerolineales bacterium]|nr:hypothetical protein [Anaerolineales bacterium]